MGMIYQGALIEAIKCHQRNQRGEVFDCKMEYCQYWREDKQTGYSICDTYKMQTDAVTLLEMDHPRNVSDVLPARARLMTLDEACASDYVWYEQRNTGLQPSSVSRVPHKPGTYRVLRLGNIDAWEGADEYGVYWRCWTARPTDVQREATEWQ